MRFGKQPSIYGSCVWKKRFAFLPRWLEDTEEFAWFELIWIKESSFGSGIFCEIYREFFSKEYKEKL